MYPKFLNPVYAEIFQLAQREIEIPKCVVQFQKWKGASLKESFGGMPVVSVEDKPMFAEEAIMQHLINEGWQTRWILTINRRHKEPIYISEWKDDLYLNQKHETIADANVVEMMKQIAKLDNNSYEGCWDVLAWKENRILFVEAKRNNKDLASVTKNKWLTAALASGLTADNFLLVQWDFNPRCA